MLEAKTYRRNGLLKGVRTQRRKPGAWHAWGPVTIAVISSAVSAGSSIWAANASRDAALRSADRTYDAKMVELGVAILTTDPSKSDVAPAREWAIGLIETHTGQIFTAEEHDKLLHQPIMTCDPKMGLSADLSCGSLLPFL